MVHDAYNEWKANQDKAKAKSAMQNKLQSGLADMFKKQLTLGGGKGFNMGALMPNVNNSTSLDTSKIGLLNNLDGTNTNMTVLEEN